MQATLAHSGEDQISLTDPDSRAMAAHTRVAVGYNAQIAVDARHKLIVEQQITNQVLDMGLLTETATAAKNVLGVERIAATADKGYFKIETSRPARQPGSTLTCRARSADRRSGRVCSARTSSATTRRATLSCVLRGSGCGPTRRRSCAG
jgi:hypothetical protein